MLTPLQIVSHELCLVFGMMIWGGLYGQLIRWFYLPGTFPGNMVFGFVSTFYGPGGGDVMHMKTYGWDVWLIRMSTDAIVTGFGYLCAYSVFVTLGADVYAESDAQSVLNKGHVTNPCRWSPIVVILLYSARILFLGLYRLGWHLICMPFTALFGYVMINIFPPNPNAPPR